MSAGGVPIPGWYPDPHDPSQLRYWDGHAWTGSTTPVNPQSQSAMSHPGQPPFAPLSGSGHDPISGQPYGFAPSGAGSGFGDIGPWMNATFSVLIGRAVNVGLLLFIVPAIGWTVGLLLLRSAVDPIRYNTVTSEFEGVSPARLIPVGLVMVATLLIGLIGWIGASHQLYLGHAGHDRSLGQSFQLAIRRLPRFIGWGLVYCLMLSLAALLFIGPVVLLVAIIGPSGLILLLLVVPLVVVGSLWIWVKLAFVPTAMAIAPSGVNPFSASWRLSDARWWPTFGRLVLVWLIVTGVSFVANIATQFVAAFTPIANVETDPYTNDVIIDGQNISELDVVDFNLFLPSVGVLVGFAMMMALSQAINQSVQISGVSGLYYQGGGIADSDL
ncbi:MAG: DUF2510 domain-containing protein [Actinomycetia bacterium]|nr:DUF2510 domain-containing protein [Actinomycetes bacterium]MCP5030895.1 DUF2510 domain-containing protein [Actinomycetes bacterium]